MDMAQTPKNHHGQAWTPAQDKQLRELARGNTPTRVIGEAGSHGGCCSQPRERDRAVAEANKPEPRMVREAREESRLTWYRCRK